jgi:hypothetical protein
MKLTLTIVGLLAAILYALIKQLAPSFPIDENMFYQIVLWVITVILGIAVEPTVRSMFVNAGLSGFRSNVPPDATWKS